jgi:hypothetical protein
VVDGVAKDAMFRIFWQAGWLLPAPRSSLRRKKEPTTPSRHPTFEWSKIEGRRLVRSFKLNVLRALCYSLIDIEPRVLLRTRVCGVFRGEKRR